MKITEITNGIHYVGVNDRCKYKFENLWPLPYGVSYNAYLITDEKNVLIDTVDAAYTDRLLDNIAEIIGDGKIDYLIINHMEPDHSASIQFIRQKYPQMTIVGNIKTLEMVKGYYGIDDNTLCIKNGESLSIGKRTLTFHLTPMVHWPETMMTYVNEDKLIFSGDAFGCFGTLDGGITDSQLNTDKYWSEMVRYYSNIVGKYGPAVQTALKKLSDIEIKTICSTHGPIWEKEITRVIGIYDRLSRYEGEPGVVIAYGSMYGHTEQMAEEIARELAANGIKEIVLHNVSHEDPSYILQNIFRYRGLIIGSPTYSNRLFPAVETLTEMIATRDIKNRTFAYFGSFTGAGAAVKHLAAFAESMKWETIPCCIEMKQSITPAIKEQCRNLAQEMAARLTR